MNSYMQFYKSLEPISEEEVEMLFPGAISTGQGWPYHPTAVRLFGVNDNGVLHMFARKESNIYASSDTHAELVQQISILSWYHFVWQENQWVYSYKDRTLPDE